MDTVADARDDVAESLVTFLRGCGADGAPHAGARSLLEHLVGTYEIVRRWNQPAWLQHAALAHSVYGTDAYRRQLVPLSCRHDLAAIVGDRAERLAYLFSVTPRGPLLAGTYRWASDIPKLVRDEDHEPATSPELDCLVLLHMANLADQARAPDGSPGVWLVRLRGLAELVADSDVVRLPLFLATLAGMSAAEEGLARRTYLSGVSRGGDPAERAGVLAVAAAACPVIGEPCVWLAHLAAARGDSESAAWWAAMARDRLRGLGAAWDKRLTYDEWHELASGLGDVGATMPPADPRGLLEAVRGRPRPPAGGDVDGRSAGAAGRRRFHRYVEALAEPLAGPAALGAYPDLPSRPWYDAASFAVASYLEAHEAEIRREVLALDGTRFQGESEAIRRTGEWDVVFLYERGRRHNDVLAACPVIARGLDLGEVMRTPAGLAYVSRLRGGTQIAPHRGPTNLRVRCHLGVQVPRGDCAIRVGEETRPWREGRCLVFDDHFEHEAWNRTDEDRIVLIIDLWHPGLTPAEVSLLGGLQEQMHAYARRLRRYWSTNERAARRSDGPG